MGKIFSGFVVVVVVVVCCFCKVPGQQDDDREALVRFLRALAGGDQQAVSNLGWDASIDPCDGSGRGSRWAAVTCDDRGVGRIKMIKIEGRGFNGTMEAALLCGAAPEIRVLSVRDNGLRGELGSAISNCSELTHLYVSGNRLSGRLPPSLGQLGRLQVLNVSYNDFSGELPNDLDKISGLKRLLANNNHFSGTIPVFDLTHFQNFSVSNNNLTGPVPEKTGRFGADSFVPNAGMCGQPFFAACPPPPPQPSSTDSEGKKGTRKSEKILMYLGYVLLGAAVLVFALYKFVTKKKKSTCKAGNGGKNASHDGKPMPTPTTSTSATKSVYSLPASAEQSTVAGASASLVVLRRLGTAAGKELRFEDLLKSPAEVLGRGRLGTSYKVALADGSAVAVKRVKDAEVSAVEFRRRMERIGRARHANVLAPVAFYCAMQEKLVVYEFQSNGSLAKLLHGSIENSQSRLDWPARLHIAAKVADGLAYMHAALHGGGDGSDGIGHGNLKASNILFTPSMDPCIGEYGVSSLPPAAAGGGSVLRADVHAFGVVLLELLTGRATAQGDGADLARWVNSVIREEWTAEVFDRAIAGDVAGEQRMVRLLQVALRCVDVSDAGPSMQQVAGMVNDIKEDERSVSSEA